MVVEENRGLGMKNQHQTRAFVFVLYHLYVEVSNSEGR